MVSANFIVKLLIIMLIGIFHIAGKTADSYYGKTADSYYGKTADYYDYLL